MTIAQLLKHGFESKGSLFFYDDNGNIIYRETSEGFWCKQEFDDNGNKIYYENSEGYWFKRDYDSNGNILYYENSTGYIIDNRPKTSCNGKVVEIEGKKYKLTEI
jgi:hypothetical protein